MLVTSSHFYNFLFSYLFLSFVLIPPSPISSMSLALFDTWPLPFTLFIICLFCLIFFLCTPLLMFKGNLVIQWQAISSFQFLLSVSFALPVLLLPRPSHFITYLHFLVRPISLHSFTSMSIPFCCISLPHPSNFVAFLHFLVYSISLHSLTSLANCLVS